MKHRTLIIGCGNIAGGLDSNQINSDRPPLTHAKAFKNNQNFDVIACIDSNQKNLLEFQKEWSISQGFKNCIISLYKLCMKHLVFRNIHTKIRGK